jgi:DNA-binding XRE family transcriptional regulator
VKNPKGVKAFGIHLRQLREAHDLSQQELADLADLAKKTIQRIENGNATSTFDVMISLARGFNITIEELIDFPLPKEKKK